MVYRFNDVSFCHDSSSPERVEAQRVKKTQKIIYRCFWKKYFRPTEPINWFNEGFFQNKSIEVQTDGSSLTQRHKITGRVGLRDRKKSASVWGIMAERRKTVGLFIFFFKNNNATSTWVFACVTWSSPAAQFIPGMTRLPERKTNASRFRAPAANLGSIWVPTTLNTKTLFFIRHTTGGGGRGDRYTHTRARTHTSLIDPIITSVSCSFVYSSLLHSSIPANFPLFLLHCWHLPRLPLCSSSAFPSALSLSFLSFPWPFLWFFSHGFISLPPGSLAAAVKVRLAPWISCRFMMLPSGRARRHQGQTTTTRQRAAIDPSSLTQRREY